MFGLHQKGIFEKPSILVGGAFFSRELYKNRDISETWTIIKDIEQGGNFQTNAEIIYWKISKFLYRFDLP